jgi:NADH-quinone oxidoreductase subunit J
MTTRPRLKLGDHLVPGLAAVALFVVMAAAFLSSEFPTPEGFGDGSITSSIGYAMFNLNGQIPSEGFLVAFEIIDIVLVAALAAAVMLARRESGSGPLGESEDVRTDGGKHRKTENTEDDN